MNGSLRTSLDRKSMPTWGLVASVPLARVGPASEPQPSPSILGVLDPVGGEGSAGRKTPGGPLGPGGLAAGLGGLAMLWTTGSFFMRSSCRERETLVRGQSRGPSDTFIRLKLKLLHPLLNPRNRWGGCGRLAHAPTNVADGGHRGTSLDWIKNRLVSGKFPAADFVYSYI
jgi:hypothetical protein